VVRLPPRASNETFWGSVGSGKTEKGEGLNECRGFLRDRFFPEPTWNKKNSTNESQSVWEYGHDLKIIFVLEGGKWNETNEFDEGSAKGKRGRTPLWES